MSEENSNINSTKKLPENIISKDKKPSNIIFQCTKCNKIPLLIPSNISNKMIKYCCSEKMAEVISPTDLLEMINIKTPKKKDTSKETIIKNGNINNNEFICPLHGFPFINYCEDCSKDICYDCSKEHIKHKLVFFSTFLPTKRDMSEGNKILSEMRNDLKKFRQNSNEIIKSFESLIFIKENILKALNKVDYEKLNFYSIMNYQNILKIKIQLNDKLYCIINPLSKMNSNILEIIKYNYEKQINIFSTRESTGKNFLDKTYFLNKDACQNNKLKILNNFELYKNFMEILEKTYDFKDMKNNNIISYRDINYISDIKNKKIENNDIFYTHMHQKNFGVKSDLSIPIINEYEKNNKNSIDNKNNINIELNNSCNFVKEINLNQEEEILDSKNIKNLYISEHEKSNIMNNTETNYIINLVSSKLKKKIKKLYLCYRATNDGDKAQNFHYKCDYIKNILILIQTKKNKKFGGFSTESWDNNNEKIWKKDKQAFIFSLNKTENRCYNIKRPEMALFCHKKYGPIFGNGEILISDNFFTYASTCLEFHTYYESKGISFPLNGEKEFFIKEMEAYTFDSEK